MIGKDLFVMAKTILQQFPNFSHVVHQFGITCSNCPIMNGADTLAEGSE